MRKITVITALMLGMGMLGMDMTMTAQTRDGGISKEMLSQITSRKTEQSAAVKALHNAIQNNSIEVLAAGKAQLGEVPSRFSVETPKQSIMNQKSSGRCWMFSGLNVLRANFTKANPDKSIVFSHDYLFFWDQLEKSNLMLQGCIDTANKDFNDDEVQFLFKSPIGDGGTFTGVADLVEKYGLVPKAVVPETYSAENTTSMRKLLARKLREYGLTLRKMVAENKSAADIRAEKTNMLKTIYDMLSLAYGTPPAEFTYAHRDKDGNIVGEEKRYTPLSFAEECGAKKINGTFVMLMNDPRNPYNKVYEIQYDRHTYDGHNWKYLNLPMEDIKKIAIAALKDGQKMYSSYDVGKFLDRKRGFASLDNFDYASLFMTEFPMTKAERIMTHDSGSTHAMTLTAVDLDDDPSHSTSSKASVAKMWKVENSWGTDTGQKGYLVMTDEWFDDYFFRLVVDNKYVPAEVQKLFKQKPVMLKYDDALFVDE